MDADTCCWLRLDWEVRPGSVSIVRRRFRRFVEMPLSIAAAVALRPMAAVIVGGTLFAALFRLLVLPVSYRTCMRFVLRRSKLGAK